MILAERRAWHGELRRWRDVLLDAATTAPIERDGYRPEWIDAAPEGTVFHVALPKWLPEKQGTVFDCLSGATFDDVVGHTLEKNARLINFAWGTIMPVPTPKYRRDWPGWSVFVQVSRPPVRAARAA